MPRRTRRNASRASSIFEPIARRAMVAGGLLPDFSPAAIAEMNALTHAAPPLGASAKDMRDLLWASIDNDDSRDLDQLSVSETLAGGAVRICVAIADVDALVKQRSAIDAHAKTNTTSVYTAAQVFPMLPEKLSTDLTSLGEGVDRQAMVIDMVVGADGAIIESDVYRSDGPQPRAAHVRRRRRMARRQGARPGACPRRPEVDEQLRVQDRVAHQLRKVRFEKGALNLETLEARAVFDEGGLSDLGARGSATGRRTSSRTS